MLLLIKRVSHSVLLFLFGREKKPFIDLCFGNTLIWECVFPIGLAISLNLGILKNSVGALVDALRTEILWFCKSLSLSFFFFSLFSHIHLDDIKPETILLTNYSVFTIWTLLMSESSMEYTLPGVLHFLQAEWRKFERERNEWTIEKAELKVCKIIERE